MAKVALSYVLLHLCLAMLATAKYVPELTMQTDAFFYVGTYDSETARCDVTTVNSTTLQHAFSVGAGGGGWSYTSLMMVLNPPEGEVDLDQPLALSFTVQKKYQDLSCASIRIAGVTDAPPDSLSYKSTGTMHRTQSQLACPPQYCRVPAVDLDGGSENWCGWAQGLENFVEYPLTNDMNDGSTVSVNVTKLTMGAELSMLQMWANPTCQGSFWDAEVVLTELAFENI